MVGSLTGVQDIEVIAVKLLSNIKSSLLPRAPYKDRLPFAKVDHALTLLELKLDRQSSSEPRCFALSAMTTSL